MMAVFRRRLRVLVAAWLLFQAATLSAFVPRACCLIHQQGTIKQTPDCHSQAAQPEAPPPHHQHGHQAPQQTTSPQPNRPVHECTVSGICGGPLAALFAALSTPGIIANAPAVILAFQTATLAAPAERHVIPAPIPPDPRPPRT
jgi:hypothetical protein